MRTGKEEKNISKSKPDSLCWLGWPFLNTPLAMTQNWEKGYLAMWGEGECLGGERVRRENDDTSWSLKLQVHSQQIMDPNELSASCVFCFSLSSCCAGLSKSLEHSGFCNWWSIALYEHCSTAECSYLPWLLSTFQISWDHANLIVLFMEKGQQWSRGNTEVPYLVS